MGVPRVYSTGDAIFMLQIFPMDAIIKKNLLINEGFCMNLVQQELKTDGTSALALHGFAMACMLLDHAGAVFGNIVFLRCIGRLAFPIFVFLLVEGFQHTRDVRRYIARCFVFGLISEIPFDLALHDAFLEFSGQNVMWTMCIGLIAMSLSKRADKFKTGPVFLLHLCIWFGACMLADFMRTDYAAAGVLLIGLFYTIRQFGSGLYVRCLFYSIMLFIWSAAFFPSPVIFSVFGFSIPMEAVSVDRKSTRLNSSHP